MYILPLSLALSLTILPTSHQLQHLTSFSQAGHASVHSRPSRILSCMSRTLLSHSKTHWASALWLWEAHADAPFLGCVLLTAPLLLYYNCWFTYHKLLEGKSSACFPTLPCGWVYMGAHNGYWWMKGQITHHDYTSDSLSGRDGFIAISTFSFTFNTISNTLIYSPC